MKEIVRIEIDEMWAHSAIVEDGDYVYISYCMKNEGLSIERNSTLVKFFNCRS